MNVLVAAGVALAVAAVGSTTISISGALLRSDRTTERTFEPVRSIDVDVDTGDVRVVASDVPAVLLRRSETWALGRPRVTETVEGDTLRIRAECTAALSWCEVSYVLTVPRGVTVVARSGSGSLALSGTGRVQADTGSGDVSLTSVTGGAVVRTGSGEVSVDEVSGESLEVRTGSGDVTVDGAATPVLDARTGSGDLRLVLATPPDSVRGETGSGDVRVLLPLDGGAYDVQVDTGSGERQIGVSDVIGAPRRVVLRTGSGDVQVLPAG